MSLQLTRCYAENKKALNTFEMHITSLNRRLGERMETVMQGVHHRWKGVEVSCDPYETVLKEVAPSNIVYLTADSPNVIRSLETEKVYIIGGIIDKNRWKVCMASSGQPVLTVGFVLREGDETRGSACSTAN